MQHSFQLVNGQKSSRFYYRVDCPLFDHSTMAMDLR
jgi:hypothetical protein